MQSCDHTVFSNNVNEQKASEPKILDGWVVKAKKKWLELDHKTLSSRAQEIIVLNWVSSPVQVEK